MPNTLGDNSSPKPKDGLMRPLRSRIAAHSSHVDGSSVTMTMLAVD